MPQRNFGRSVARAAASGGGKAYRSRPAIGWYLTMILIVAVGVSLVVYSRQEALHPQSTAAKTTTEGPHANDSWHAALSIDLCGVVQKALPVNSNLTATGLRTYGDGLIYIQPSAATTGSAASFEGANASLANFASHYPKFTLTSTSIQLPATKLYRNGALCHALPKGATAAEKAAATGSLKIETWASPTAKGKVLTNPNPSTIHLTNGQMISIGFVTPGQTLPVPQSKSSLVSILGPSTSTTSPSSSTTSTT
jgi:hypothetical protein